MAECAPRSPHPGASSPASRITGHHRGRRQRRRGRWPWGWRRMRRGACVHVCGCVCMCVCGCMCECVCVCEGGRDVCQCGPGHPAPAAPPGTKPSPFQETHAFLLFRGFSVFAYFYFHRPQAYQPNTNAPTPSMSMFMSPNGFQYADPSQALLGD